MFHAGNLSGLDLIKLHIDYGHFIGKEIERFTSEHDIQPDICGSHGDLMKLIFQVKVIQ